MWLLVVTWAMVLSCSTGWVSTMASGGSTSYSHQAVPHHSLIFRTPPLLGAQTILLLLLSHLFTTHLHTSVVPSPVGRMAGKSLGVYPAAPPRTIFNIEILT